MPYSDCVSFVFQNQLWGFLIFVFNFHEEMDWLVMELDMGWLNQTHQLKRFKRLMVKTQIIRMRKQKIL